MSSRMFEHERVKDVYLAFTDVLDRHEEFSEQDIKRFVGLCLIALEGFEVE